MGSNVSMAGDPDGDQGGDKVSDQMIPAPLSRVKHRRRCHLLQAAQRVFLRDGWAATTMEAVAAEAAISKQTLYNYFPD